MDIIARKRLLLIESPMYKEGGSRKAPEPAWWFPETNQSVLGAKLSSSIYLLHSQDQLGSINALLLQSV